MYSTFYSKRYICNNYAVPMRYLCGKRRQIYIYIISEPDLYLYLVNSWHTSTILISRTSRDKLNTSHYETRNPSVAKCYRSPAILDYCTILLI